MTIQINEPFRNTQDVFLHIVKKSKKYELFKGYTILDELGNYISKFYIHSIKPIRLNDIDTETAILYKDSSPEIVKQILTEYHEVKEHDMLYKIVFSKSRPIRYYD